MKLYFDESGSFSVKNPGPHIMVGIGYPEVFDKRLKLFYDSFIESLTLDEYEKGEPKGRTLSIESRNKLFVFLMDNSWLKICVYLTDSEFNSIEQVNQYRTTQLDIYKRQLSDPIFLNQSNELIELQNKLIKDFSPNSGLSDVQIVKGLLLMHTMSSLLMNLLSYFTSEVYDDNWERIYVCYDRQEKESITKMEDWVKRDFLNLISQNNAKNPIELCGEWFDRNHPILQHRDGNLNRLNLNKMFINGISFENSESCC